MEDKTEFTLIHDGWKQTDELIGKANQKALLFTIECLVVGLEFYEKFWGNKLSILKHIAEKD